MGARLRSWWQQIKQHRVAILVGTVVLVVAIALIIIEVWFYGTGFNGYTQVSTIHTISGPTAGTVTRTELYQPGKTLWDWMQLLFIPVVLAVAGFWFNHRERKAAELRSGNERKAAELRAKTESDIAEDNQREEALKEYIDKISELLLHEKLRESKPVDEVRTIARVLTLTVVRRCDAERKGSVLLFLHEAGLIDTLKGIIDLDGAFLWEANLSSATLSFANLSKANLSGANLSKAFVWEANLHFANLSGANLSKAFLNGADLSAANLSGANLKGASLSGANLLSDLPDAELSGARLDGARLDGADLDGAEVTEEQLKKAKTLKGATMPDGSIHP